MELCALNLDVFMNGELKMILEKEEFFNLQLPKANEHNLIDLSCLTVRGIIEQITRGLEFIHSKGEMHRDIKPSNGTMSMKENGLTI